LYNNQVERILKMGKNPALITKASGAKEPFSQQKLENSLKKAGADNNAIKAIINKIYPFLYEGISTKKIYRKAFKLLVRQKGSVAARYSLKKAIMELGPTGYPFEHFIGQLLQHSGLQTQVGQILEGKCVNHEVDVIATGGKIQYLIECKYYNSQGKYADVKVPMYIRSRFEDIVAMRKNLPEYKDFSFSSWIVTNTRFTSDASAYGKCAGLHLVSWDFPADQSLKAMIESEGLFPVTVLTSLNKEQKQIFLDKGIVLCRQIVKESDLLDKVVLSQSKKQKVIDEIKDLTDI